MTTEPPPAAVPAADPFTSLAVHYGMLLGVSDFQVLAANPRGKLQLHQAWQHGKGVVWGYDVGVSTEEPELVAGPGLAIDGLGRELQSSAPMCLNVPAWAKDQDIETAGDRTTVDARLYVRFETCLSRPVPSLGGTCGQTTDAVDYSRVIEQAHLELRAYPKKQRDHCAPQARDPVDEPYSALRALVRDGVLPDGQPVPPQGWLQAFRAVAAQAGAGLGPPGLVPRLSEHNRLYPEDEPGEVLLADLPGLTLVRTGTTWRVEAPTIDLSVRRAHVPTWIAEELIAELLAGSAIRRPVTDAKGPRVIRVRRTGDRVTVELTREVAAATVKPALEVRAFDAADPDPGWGPPLDLTPVVRRPESGQPPVPARIEFQLPAVPTATLRYRMVLRGTGTVPLVSVVGRRPVPLAGRVGDPAGSAADGHDVVEVLDEGVRE